LQVQGDEARETAVVDHDASVQQRPTRAGLVLPGLDHSSDDDGDWSLGPSKKGKGKVAGRAGRKLQAAGSGLL
jgi:hypothetical protein